MNLKSLLLTHVIAFLCSSVFAQADGEHVSLQIDLRNEKGKVQVKLQDAIQDISAPLNINFTNTPVEIRFVNYKKNHLVKFYVEEDLDCDPIELHLDSNTMSSAVQIIGGQLVSGENHQTGAMLVVAIPDKKFRLSINTQQAALITCPVIAEPDEQLPARAIHKIGVPYYDALYLKAGKELAIKREILLYYAGLTSGAGTCEQILDNLKGNDFFYSYAQTLCQQITATGEQQASLSISSILTSVSGIDVTTVANGISMFMIKRAKEELTISFFNHFKTFVAANTEFQVLFPKTTENLGNLLSYRYPEMLPALRSGFFEDIDKITYRLDDVLELPRYADLLRSFPEIRVTIRSLRLVHEIEAGTSHPADVLRQFAELPEWSEEETTYDFQNFGSSVKLASLFSQSLRNEPEISLDSTRAWVTLKELKSLLRDDTAFKIYLGLIYQQVKQANILFWQHNQSRRFDSIMLAQKANIFLFENKLTEFIELAAKVDKVKNDLRQAGKLNITTRNEDYYSYINTSIDVIEYGFSIADLFHKDFNGTRYTRIARNCNDLYRHIYKQEYSQAITNAMSIFNQVKDLLKSNKPRLDTAMEASVNRFSDFVSKTKKYALFMGNMADAGSPEEVEAILENAVLPVGSSSVKKNSDFNISVQSYLGAYTRIGTLKHRTKTAWSDQVGISAPIGLAFSRGFARWGSITLFASLFDLGAVVDYRLRNDTLVDPNGNREEVVEKDYKIELGQILSPGAFIVYGFGRNLPLSVGIGGQWGPGLSRINDRRSAVVNNPHWRWSITFGVDIPFFTLRNKMKNYTPETFRFDE